VTDKFGQFLHDRR